VDKAGKKYDKRVILHSFIREFRDPGADPRLGTSPDAPLPDDLSGIIAEAIEGYGIRHTRGELNEVAASSSLADLSELDSLQNEVDSVLRAFAASRRRRPLDSVPVVSTSIETFQRLDVDSLPIGKVSRMYVALGTDPLSLPIAVPIMVARGMRAGPTFGLTSALHGNELNGMPLIHRLFEEIDCSELAGSIVAVIVANPHGYTRYQRGGPENTDLNRVMPGRKDGTAAQQFAFSLLKNVIGAGGLDFLLDLHTASFGRVNSLYVRADLTDPVVFRLAMLQHPQIVVHNKGKDGTLRGAAADLGIHTLTLEIGNPQRFHRPFIERALAGVYRTLRHLHMLPAVADDVTERVSQYMFPGHVADSASSSSSAAAHPASVVTDVRAAEKGLTATPTASVAFLGAPSTAGILAAADMAETAAPARAPMAVNPLGLVRGIMPAETGPEPLELNPIRAPVRATAKPVLRRASLTAAGASAKYPPVGSVAASMGSKGSSLAMSTTAGTLHARPPFQAQSPMRGPAIAPAHPLSTDTGAWRDPVICSKSFWIFTRTGGVLYVVPPVYSWVRKGDVIADVRSIFGHCVQRYFAPCDGIVIGKSDNPVCQNGDRIVHIGIAGGEFGSTTDDGHP
jgi:predicted deacylase